MFTKEFIIESAIKAERKENANTILWKMRSLGIVNGDVNDECNAIIKEYDDINKVALDYMFSFVPKKLKKKLNVIRMSGAFVTNLTGTSSMSAELSLHLEDNILTLKFDNENKCLYHQSWLEDNYASLLDKYFKDNSNFDNWIKFK